MKYSLKSSFAKLVLVLFMFVLALTIVGRIVTVTDARVYCIGWPLCRPTALLGWLQLLHVVLAGTSAVLMLLTLRKAWREQRDKHLLLPLITITSILFFGQVFTGAILVTRAYPVHLLVLHALSAATLWVSLGALLFTSGTLDHELTRLNLGTRGTPLFQHNPIGSAVNSRAASGSSPLPSQRIKDFFILTKPLIVMLLLLTTYAGLVAGSKGWPSLSLTFWTLLGGMLAAGGASAMNQYIDRELDKRMQRTSRRPLAEGRLTAAEGLSFGLALCLISYYIMAGFVNFLAALLSLIGIIYYVLFYSLWLKKATVQNIVIGGGAGAIPPIVGWAAATGHLSLAAWILFAIVFMWTPPHFWALAIVRKSDYARAGVPMLPVVRGEGETRRQILVYTLELVAVSLLLPIFKLAGLLYLISALAMGGALLYTAWRVWRIGGNKVAWTMYRWSSIYLAFIFLAIVIDAVTVVR